MKSPRPNARNLRARRAIRAANAPSVANIIGKTRRLKRQLDLLAEDIFVALTRVQQTDERKLALEKIRSGVVAASTFLYLNE